MRELKNEEIEVFASRKGAKKIAVENFLMSMGTDENEAEFNLGYDAVLYKWNAVTQKAMRDGIALAKKVK